MAFAAPVMMAVSMASSAAGAVTSAMGASAQGKASAQQAQYQAAISRMNEQVARQNADYTRAVGEYDASRSGRQTRYDVGKAKTIQAASGMDINVGTPAAVREGMQDIGYENQQVIRTNAARKAYGHEVEAVNASAQGKMYDAAAVNAKTASKYAIIGSLISGASSVSSKWTSSGFGGSSQALGG